MFIKFLMVLAFFYLLFRVAGGVLRLLFGGMQQPRQPHNPYNTGNAQSNRPKDGNVHVDYVPKDSKKRKEFKGGDYIDYEEV